MGRYLAFAVGQTSRVAKHTSFACKHKLENCSRGEFPSRFACFEFSPKWSCSAGELIVAVSTICCLGQLLDAKVNGTRKCFRGPFLLCYLETLDVLTFYGEADAGSESWAPTDSESRKLLHQLADELFPSGGLTPKFRFIRAAYPTFRVSVSLFDG